jgi:hypothetical protein
MSLKLFVLLSNPDRRLMAHLPSPPWEQERATRSILVQADATWVVR